MAAPPGWIVRYDYRTKLLTDEVVQGLNERDAPLPRDILLLYAQDKAFSRGDDPPKQTPPFADTMWVPTRLARMVNVVANAERFFFDFEVLEYPSPGPAVEAIVRTLHDSQATPFRKWIAFAFRDAGVDFTGGHSTDKNWLSIVVQLDVPPSQFAGDLFWRVSALKPLGRAGTLSPRRQTEKEGDSIRQVRSHFLVNDGSKYVAEIVTIRSPQKRGGGVPQQYKILGQSDNRELLRPIGNGEIEARQYTSEHLELETGRLLFPTSQRTDLTLSTVPRVGAWPDGPELKLRFEIRKPVRVLVLALAGLTIGTVLTVKEARAVFGSQGSSMDVFLLVAGVILVVLGATLWTGRASTK
jgi:hypothetical protein